jgi:hypothetical protein
MNDLLTFAVDAHGGLARWNTFTNLRAEVSIGGAIWDFKQQPGLLVDKVFEINTHAEQLVITPFTGPDLRSVFVPDRLVRDVQRQDGGSSRRSREGLRGAGL